MFAISKAHQQLILIKRTITKDSVIKDIKGQIFWGHVKLPYDFFIHGLDEKSCAQAFGILWNQTLYQIEHAIVLLSSWIQIKTRPAEPLKPIHPLLKSIKEALSLIVDPDTIYVSKTLKVSIPAITLDVLSIYHPKLIDVELKMHGSFDGVRDFLDGYSTHEFIVKWLREGENPSTHIYQIKLMR